MRFRRSIKIAKGVRINFSKTGLSATLGPRGASVNTGKKGAYLASQMPNNISIHVQPDGAIVVLDEFNILINDETMLRRLKKTDMYKGKLNFAMRLYKEEIENETREFVEIYKLAPSVMSLSDFKKVFNQLEPQQYEKVPFAETEPSEVAIKPQLEQEAIEKIKTFAFWRKRKLRQKYVEDEMASRLPGLQLAWKNRKDEHENLQQEEEIKANELYEFEFELKKEGLEKAIEGDTEHIQAEIDDWLSTVELPVDFDISYDFVNGTNDLLVDMVLPRLEDMPSEKSTETAKGQVKRKAKTQKEIKYEYMNCVLGLAVFFSSNLLNISPCIKNITVSGYVGRRNKKSDDLQDDYVFSIRFNRHKFERADFQKIELLDFWQQFENRYIHTSTYDMKPIVPYDV